MKFFLKRTYDDDTRTTVAVLGDGSWGDNKEEILKGLSIFNKGRAPYKYELIPTSCIKKLFGSADGWDRYDERPWPKDLK
jgi:hypothetical protein